LKIYEKSDILTIVFFLGGIFLNTAAIQKILLNSKTDAVIITSPENIYYFSGFKSADAVLLLTASDCLIFTDSRYFIQASQQAPFFTLCDITTQTVAAKIKEEGFKLIGFEEDFVTYSSYNKLLNDLSCYDAELVPISRFILRERQIKTEKEIEYIKKAAQIADNAFSFILDKIEPGKKEKDIALMLDYYMLKSGAEAIAFETICASGVRSAMPHGVASDKVIEKGDFVTLDFGCKYEGYCSDMTRTVVCGKATSEQKQIYNTVLSAQKAAILEVKPNNDNSYIDSVARGIINDAGYGENFGHALGHSLGLNVHESPVLSKKSTDKLKSGIFMTVEPGIYIENFGGVRIEDLLLVTYNGHVNLTTSEKELIELK